MTRCSINGCEKPSRSRGWCVMHYGRWTRHGDPEKTLTAADGEPAQFMREASLIETADCVLWPYSRDSYGYGNIWHEGEMHPVHRLVCREENGPPPTPRHEVAHSCGKGHLGCVNRKHLEWKTHAENMADKYRHGTMRGPLSREAIQSVRSF